MAKSGALTHRKTRRLAKLLGIQLPFALGLRETLQHVTKDHARDGGIGCLPDESIAEEMFYDGEAGELIQAFVDAGILDPHPDDGVRLFLHGWPEHCEDLVHMSMARGRKFFADGTTPNWHRLSGKERDAAEAFYVEHCAHGVRTDCAVCAHGDAQRLSTPPRPASTPPRPLKDSEILSRSVPLSSSGGGKRSGAAKNPLPASEEDQRAEVHKQSLVIEIGELTGEGTEKAGVYRQIVDALPERDVRIAIDQLRESLRSETSVKNAGALFVTKCKQQATARGIVLFPPGTQPRGSPPTRQSAVG